MPQATVRWSSGYLILIHACNNISVGHANALLCWPHIELPTRAESHKHWDLGLSHRVETGCCEMHIHMFHELSVAIETRCVAHLAACLIYPGVQRAPSQKSGCRENVKSKTGLFKSPIICCDVKRKANFEGDMLTTLKPLLHCNFQCTSICTQRARTQVGLRILGQNCPHTLFCQVNVEGIRV